MKLYFRNGYDLLGWLFGQCIEKGMPEGAGPLDAADFMGDISDAVCRMNDPGGCYSIEVESGDHTGEYTEGFVHSMVGSYGVNGRDLQCFTPLGRVTIRPERVSAMPALVLEATIAGQDHVRFTQWGTMLHIDTRDHHDEVECSAGALVLDTIADRLDERMAPYASGSEG